MIDIIQGEDKIITITLRDKVTKVPLDLTGHSIDVCFLNTDDTKLDLAVGSGITILAPNTNGQFKITLTNVQTDLLKVLTNVLLEVKLTDAGSLVDKIQFKKAYNVIAKDC